MASIVENADDAIIGKTLDGITTSWNPAVEELFGYSNQNIRRGLIRYAQSTCVGAQRGRLWWFCPS